MLWLKLIRKLIKTLNSDGSPGQVALGIALGAAWGLTPLFNLHNLLLLAAVMLFNVSFPAAMLGWMLFAPAGFVLDPLFDAIGRFLLVNSEGLRPFWTAWTNAPVLPWARFNNTVVLGSFVGWLLLVVPTYLAARLGVERYRDTVYRRIIGSRAYRWFRASRIYDIYRLFQVDS